MFSTSSIPMEVGTWSRVLEKSPSENSSVKSTCMIFSFLKTDHTGYFRHSTGNKVPIELVNTLSFLIFDFVLLSD